jgi:hypothetical protein
MSPRTATLMIAASAFIATTLAASIASAKPNTNPNNQTNHQTNNQVAPAKKPLIGSNPITWSPKKPIDPGFGKPHKPCKLIGCDPISKTPDWTHNHRRPHWWLTTNPYSVSPTVIVPGATRYVSAPSRAVVSTSNRPTGNCLAKQYLADGSLLFKDLCTSEFAVATPEQLQAEANGLKPPQ